MLFWRVSLSFLHLNEDSEFKSVMWGVNCLKQDLQDLSDLQEWTSLLTETPVIELPNYLLKLHKNRRYYPNLRVNARLRICVYYSQM